MGIASSSSSSSSSASRKLCFEDMHTIRRNGTLLVSTLPETDQGCLLVGTTPFHEEEALFNRLLQNKETQCMVAVYGRHCNDESVVAKVRQLQSLGFLQVYQYPGGMFEWLLLQDIYGADEFPTTRMETDLLRFRPPVVIGRPLLGYRGGTM
jgi:hypothetical protein